MGDSRPAGDRLGLQRRDLLAVLGAAGIASLAGCNQLGGGKNPSDNPGDRPLPDLGATSGVYVGQLRSDLPKRPNSSPAVGITSEGNYVFDGADWLGPIGIGSADHPAEESHFRSATIHGPLEALGGVVDGDEFDVRSFGAAIDGKTDDLQAIQGAVDEAAKVGGTVVIPPGTTRISNHISLGSQHSGITIRGYGYDSHIRLDGGHTENHYGILIGSDSGGPIRNVTIENVRLDGNRAEQKREHGLGIQMLGSSSDDRNIRIQNVWSHDWMLEGIGVRRGGVVLRGAAVWNNRLHGIGIRHESMETNLITDVYAWNNGEYGIDVSGGRNIVTNFTLVENGWGFKTGGGNPEMTIFSNGSVVNNEHLGFQMTSPVDVLMIDNVECKDNGSTGFRFDQGGVVLAGNLVATGNGGEANVYVGGADLYANSLVVQGSKQVGLLVTGEAHVGRLLTSGNEGPDIEVGNGARLVLDYTDAGRRTGPGTLIEGGVANVSLGGRAPDARQFATGNFVYDTDGPNRVYLIHDASKREGYVRIS